MKQAGTLKVEIIKPTTDTWKRVGDRLRAMRGTLPLALNFAFRDVYPRAMAELEAAQKKEKADQGWQNDVRKRLRFHWSEQLQRRQRFMTSGRKPVTIKDLSVFNPVGDVLCSETSDHIVSRFKGDHFRALLAGRAGVPTFEGGGKSFFSEGRDCVVSGGPSEARLSFPLWGSGSKATEFVVAPSGSSARILWERLVRDFEQREKVVGLERAAKAPIPKEAPQEVIDQARRDRDEAAHALIEMKVLKLGKVGIKFDERKRKWFALISWSAYLEEGYQEGQAAAVNFGCHTLIQAMAEDGTTWDRPGRDVQEARLRFSARRWSLAKSKRSHGRGSRGHGKTRRELPMLKLSECESSWVRNWIRTMAADFGKWCVLHRVSDVHLEDLTGIRDTFENQTGGDAPEQLKRLIHQWPYYESQQAIERQLKELGIRCHYKTAQYVSQRCPSCRHTEADNVKVVNFGGQPKMIDGELYRKVESRSQFECKSCGLKAAGDVIACANHLIDVGKTHALEKMQEAGRKRSKIGGNIARGKVEKTASTVAAE